MKKTLLLMVFTATGHLFAQSNWTKLGPPPPAIQILDEFDNVTASDHAYADIDNDGDQDVLLAGATFSDGFICKLFVNDGTGAFVHDATAPFVGVYNGSVAFADLDNDSDQDAIVTGIDNVTYSSRLYINDGSGAFSLASSPFEGVGYSALAIEDVDGDSDLDVFIGGQSMYGLVSNLYMNDGNAGFSLNTIASSTFPGIYFGTAEFGDIDADGDADFMLMGYGESGSHAELYTNNGNAVFTLVPITFPALNSGDIAFSDVDGDAYQDLFISGDDPSTGPTTILYINNEVGGFSASTGSSFTQTGSASVDFGDIDNDGDDDLLLAGNTWSIGTATQLYTNDGNGIFSLVPGTSITAISNGSAKFTDLDGDSDPDILVTGNYQAGMFFNDGAGTFSAIPTTPFTAVTSGAVEFSDVDNDGDLDVLITGQGQATFSTQLYLNDGLGGYSYDNTNSFPNVANSAADFADIDGDGDEDMMISGYGSGQLTQLFTNDGTGLFSLVSSPFPNLSSGSVEFHDVENDGDQDVVLTGFNSSGNHGQLWLNDGNGNFSLSTNNFEATNNSSVSFADIDGDDDDDLLITGYGDAGRTAKLYTNDGTGQFTLIPSPFPGVQQGATDFADIDGDGDMDLVIAGEIGSSTYTSELYTNDGTGNFTLVPGTPFDPTITSGMIFADIDSDLDPDLMTIGNNDAYQCIAKMYLNDGSGNFTLIASTPFEAASQGMMNFGDIDGDNDLDLVIAGNNCFTGVETNLYRNDNCQQSNVIDVQHACSSFTWIDGIEYTTNNNTASMTYTNAAGCDSVVVLHLTIGDYSLIPDVAALPNVTAECEITSLTPPTAMFNCSGAVTATTNQSFPITLQDTTEVTWTYTGNNGVEITQTQLVIIHDMTAPVPDLESLPVYTSPCVIFAVPVIPTAMDNCGGTITGTTTDLPVGNAGTTTITWTFTDANGNSSIQTQDIVFTPPNLEITFDGTALTVAQDSATYQWIDCNTEEDVPGATDQTFTPSANGSYAVNVIYGACAYGSDCFTITNLAVHELEWNNITIYPNPNTGAFTIETTNAVSITISNSAGQLVYTEKLQSGKTEIDLKDLENGVYFVNSVGPNGAKTTQKLSILK